MSARFYTYDDNGNITSVVQDGVTTSYTYDALGQLIRVVDGQEGATWEYSYDEGGNILSKKKYVDDTLVESKTFTYGNSNWKDQLTAVNGAAITYDQIGNPLNDGTWTYTWEKGRQLKSMSKSGTTASFKYNENGLRIQKTVNSVVTNYTLHGKSIVHMTQGSNELHFFYDASNRPAIVEFNGTKYAYVHNLQGDIVAILDSNGNKVVEYKYDAWGKPISKTGSLASTLGTVQPFRYRGYVYDAETEAYYLRSRYYSPYWCRFVNEDAVVGRGTLLTHNAYTYCLCNPIAFIDKTGYEVTINVYNNDFTTIFDFDLGHVDISINGTVYSYGRYQGSYHGPRGLHGMLGPGIFVVGNEGYMIGQHRNDAVVARYTLDLTEEQEQLFSDYFANLIDEATKIETFDEGLSSERTWYSFPSSHKYHEYNLITNNCTTFTVDAFEYALGDDCPYHMHSVFVPSEMYNTLESDFLKKYVKTKEVLDKQ